MNHDVKRTIMSIGAHADDIEINTGATLLKYREMGYEIIYVMATNNMSGQTAELREDGCIVRFREAPLAMMERRKHECDAAAKVLGTTPIHLDHPQRHYNTGNGDETAELRYGCALPEGVPADIPTIITAYENPASIERVVNFILNNDPECVFTHGVSCDNIEHFATSFLVTKAFWKAVEKGYQGGLLHWNEGYTPNGGHHIRWDTYVNGNGYLDKKMKLIGLHECQMPTAHKSDHGHRLLAEWRGKVCGCKCAEVFNWVRRPTRCSTTMNGFASPIMGELTTELVQNSH